MQIQLLLTLFPLTENKSCQMTHPKSEVLGVPFENVCLVLEAENIVARKIPPFRRRFYEHLDTF